MDMRRKGWRALVSGRPVRRGRRNRPPLAVEGLEGRALLATLSLVGSTVPVALQYQAGVGVANDLTVSVAAGSVYTFTETAETITLDPALVSLGWILDPTQHVATGPRATAFNVIAINTADLADTVTIQSADVPMSVSTGDGDDRVNFQATSLAPKPNNSYIVDGGLGNDLITVFGGPPPINPFTPGSISVSQAPVINYTNVENVDVVNSTDPALTPVPRTVNAVQNVPLTNVAVGSFSDLDPAARPTDYLVSIDWGDGTPPTPGTVVAAPTGIFDVQGTHTYYAVPTFPITVDVHDRGSTSTTTVSNTTVRVLDNGGATTAIHSTALVRSSTVTVTVTGVPIAQVENTPFSGPVATFVPLPETNAAHYSATIDWGDGSAPTAGTVTAGTNGQFVVNGTHTYTEEGHYTVKVAVSFFNGDTTQVVGTGTTTATISEDFVVTNTNDSGPGSLRDLIDDLNGDGFGGTIAFHIPGPAPHVIHLLSPLSPVNEPVVIDGSTEPGFAGRPVVVLDGGAVPSGDGLDLYGAGSGVESLTISGFRGGVGVTLQGPGVRFVVSCFIGTDPSGTLAAPNFQGVLILGSSGNVLARNVISGNLSAGVQVFDNLNVNDPGQVWALPPAHASGNQILSNFIGTDVSGTLPLPNQQGVYINDAAGNLVSGNIIAGNRSIGVQVLGEAATGNAVMGNWVGTDLSFTRPLGNGLGIFVYAAPGNTVAANVDAFNPQGNLLVRPLAAGPEVEGVTFTRDAAGNLTGASILFTTYLDRAHAQNPTNYRIAILGANSRFLGTVPLGAPVYSAIQRTAFVPFARPVPASATIQLRISGRGPGAITDRVGNPLAGISSRPVPGGSDFVANYRNGVAS